jgi:putative membrane protein
VLGDGDPQLSRVQATVRFRFLIAGMPGTFQTGTKSMKMKSTFISQICIVALALTTLSVAGVAVAQQSPAAKSSSLSEKDKTFMKKASKGGTMEVAMGKLAEQNGQSDDVKSFGKRMVTDHGKANDELKQIASQKNVTLPAKEPKVSWSSDKAYIDAMVKDHEKDLAEFQGEAQNGTDPDIKKFADDKAKMVQEHLDLAKQIQSKLK